MKLEKIGAIDKLLEAIMKFFISFFQEASTFQRYVKSENHCWKKKWKVSVITVQRSSTILLYFMQFN